MLLALAVLVAAVAGVPPPPGPALSSAPALLVEAAADTSLPSPAQAWLWTDEAPRLVTLEPVPGVTPARFHVPGGCAGSGFLLLLGPGVLSEPIEISLEGCGETVIPVKLFPGATLTGTARPSEGTSLPPWGWIDAMPCGAGPATPVRVPIVFDEAGAFSVAVPARCVEPVLRAAGFAPVRLAAIEVKPSTTTPLGRIELRGGAWIEARVISAEDGKPVPRTVVWAVPESEWEKATCAQSEGSFAALGAGFPTGPSGWVTLTGLSSGVHMLAAESPGHAPALFGPIEADARGTKVDPLELGRPGRITISIPALAELVDAGVPVRLRAHPALLPDEALSCFVFAPVGNDGSGTLEGLAGGTWQVGIVVVAPSGLELVGNEPVFLHAGEDLHTTMDLSGMVVHGTVERRGKPARCDIAMRRTRDFFSSVAHSGRSRENGTFAMLVSEPDVYTVELKCFHPRLRATVPEVKVPLDGKKLRIAIPDAQVSGTVVDRAGQPLPGYHVQALLDVAIEAGTSRERTTPILALAGPTDETGAFVLDGLAPGRWALNAARDGRRCGAVREVDLGENETLNNVMLRAEPGVRLAGRVLAGSGAGVADARLRVAVALPGTVQALELLWLTTDATGGFEYEIGAGGADVVNIGVSARGFPATAFRVPAKKGLVLTLPSHGGSLEIEGPPGDSFAWARSLLLGNEAGGVLLLSDLHVSRNAARLTVESIAPGLWRLLRIDDRVSVLLAFSGAGFGVPGPVARVTAGGVTRVTVGTPATP